jgi:hypothetical protein
VKCSGLQGDQLWVKGGADLRLAESTAHPSLEPIRSSARKHLVDTQHVEGVDADAQVEGVLSGVLGHVLVSSHTSRLKCLHSTVGTVFRELLLRVLFISG